MAEAIACGINGRFPIEIIGRNKDKIIRFIDNNKLLNVTYHITSNEIDVKDKIVILAIKPYVLESFKYINNAQILYSVLAGIDIDRLKKVCNSKSYCRVMPNVASFIKAGISAIYLDDISNKDLTYDIWNCIGEVVFLEKEALINPSGAIAGSGPAYLGLIAEALIDAGVREGLDLKTSQTLVNGLFKGFGKLLDYKSANSIRLDTTSPSGTTAEALQVMELAGLRGIIRKAINKANKKANNIS